MVARKKRILFITHLYFPALGGAERVFQRIAEGLARMGHEVTVLTSDALSTEHYYSGIQDPPPMTEILNGVHVIRQSLNTRIYRLLRYPASLNRVRGFASLFGSLVFGPHFFSQFIAVAKQTFDVVIAGPTPATTIYYALLYKTVHPSSRLVIFPHMHINDRMHTAAVNIWALKRAAFVLALTDVEKNYLMERGIREIRLKRIVNGVDDFVLKTPRRKNEVMSGFVLFLGQEGEHKRIPSLIEAMAALWKEGLANPLVIAGARSNYSPAIDRAIESLPGNLRSKVKRVNNFPEEEKVRLLDGCLALVNPSSFEAFGIVFLEAWARGKPVIGGRIPAVREIIRDGINGFLFDPSKEGDLKDKISRLLHEPSLAERLGRAGKAEVEDKYVWRKIVGGIEASLLRS